MRDLQGHQPNSKAATVCVEVFLNCVAASTRGELIHRDSRGDKEFHFQNWVDARLTESGVGHSQSGRNSYPDFNINEISEGYEVKGLATPGRWANYDSNSQPPSGAHDGRAVFFVFGTYPKDPPGNEYPVETLVICHGDFINCDHDYVHQNKSFRGFGSFGDIMVRNRKMYVPPTPFALADGLDDHFTLIVPSGYPVSHPGLVEVGTLERVERDELVIGSIENWENHTLEPMTRPNPTAGTKHSFTAYQPKLATAGSVRMKSGAAQAEPVIVEDGDTEP